MKLKGLENGMAVRFISGDIGAVYRNFMTWDYIINDTGRSLKNINVNELNTNLEDCGIVEVRSIQSFCNDSFLKPSRMFKQGKLIWKKEEAVEMTLEEICSALGKNIKIVKENKC